MIFQFLQNHPDPDVALEHLGERVDGWCTRKLRDARRARLRQILRGSGADIGESSRCGVAKVLLSDDVECSPCRK
jgi:hypothetical protein